LAVIFDLICGAKTKQKMGATMSGMSSDKVIAPLSMS
jgi:hypothetical protein